MFLRHGLPGALLAAGCLTLPEMRTLLAASLEPAAAAPTLYGTIGAALACGLIAFVWFLDRRIDAAAAAWVLYLLALSVWEEWLFRVAIPHFGQAQGMDLRLTTLVAGLAFGVMHYFTLRWKWTWCVAACLGGLALSRHFNTHFDLAMIVAFHWVATVINTPRLPGRRPSFEGSSAAR